MAIKAAKEQSDPSDAVAGASASGAPNSPADNKGGIVTRCFSLLEAVGAASRPLAVADLIETLELPRATVYRLVDWLLSEGFLSREPARKRLVVGPRLTDLATEVLRASVAMGPRRAVLKALAEATGETCTIGIMEADSVVYIDRVESDHWPLRLHLPIGVRVPLHATAIGKLFLSFLPARQRRALLGALDPRAVTARTITDPQHLSRELGRVRGQGFAVDDQEFLPGVVAIAVPVLNSRGEIRAAMGLQAPESRISAAEAPRYLPALQQAADSLARTFGAATETVETRAAAGPPQRRAASGERRQGRSA